LKVHTTWEFIVKFQLHKSIQFALTPQKLKVLSLTHNDSVHSEHSFVSCWILDNSERWSAIPGTFRSGEWWRSVGPSVWKIKCYERERKILLKINRKKANWTGHIFLGTAFINTLLKEIQKERKQKEGDVSSYWINLSKWSDIRNRKKTH
jgi:hypothetical protein